MTGNAAELVVVWPARQADGRTPLGGVLHDASCRHARRVIAADPDRVDRLGAVDAWQTTGWSRACGVCRPLGDGWDYRAR